MKTQKLILCIVLAGVVGILLLTCIGNTYAGQVTYTVDSALTGDGYISVVWTNVTQGYPPQGYLFPGTMPFVPSEQTLVDNAESRLIIGTNHQVSFYAPPNYFWWRISLLRGYTGFDLTAFPELANANLTSAVLSLYCAALAQTNFTVRVYPSSWNPTLEASDWGSWTQQLLGSKSSSSFSAGSYNDIALTDLSGINLGEASGFALISSNDVGGPDGTSLYIWPAMLEIGSANGSAPKLLLTFTRYTISGYIREYDSNGNPTPVANNNVTVTGDLVLATPNSPTSTPSTVVTTDGNGYYTLEVVRADNAVISTQYSDYIITPCNIGNVTGNVNYDFGLYTIDGYVKRYGTSEGINGVNVTITGGETAVNRTTADRTLGDPGYYRAYVGHSGSRQYTVTPSNP